ncbi:MAG: serine hydrolase [Gloeomargaritaceae cyanobacterium C42_A2020_066]|nr:serine hydrolase [Gloeomargaritaceae cyanobacterium C42_A2020_066]
MTLPSKLVRDRPALVLVYGVLASLGMATGGLLGILWGRTHLVPNWTPPEVAHNLPLLPGIWAYNVRRPAVMAYSPQLQAIVNEQVASLKAKGVPTAPLSITLIDIRDPQAPQFAGYQQSQLRYPASVSKLFWMVAFFGALQAGRITDAQAEGVDVAAMVRDSSNDAASDVIDLLTGTRSGATLPPAEFEVWQRQRQQLTTFFTSAGFTGLDVNHKNFPLFGLGWESPQGRELQLRGGPEQPSRNAMTTAQAGRLLYEIYLGQAVSPNHSRQMRDLLRRDLRPAAWQGIPNNAVEGFLGEGVPPAVTYLSKEGLTTTSRQEAALVASNDGQMAYILVVFGDHPAYAADLSLFPAVSRGVHERMVQGIPAPAPRLP